MDGIYESFLVINRIVVNLYDNSLHFYLDTNGWLNKMIWKLQKEDIIANKHSPYLYEVVNISKKNALLKNNLTNELKIMSIKPILNTYRVYRRKD